MPRTQAAWRRAFGAAIDDPTISMKSVVLPGTDWVAESLKGLAPVTAGRFFVHGSHDRHRVPAHAVAIEIDAAQAFGTGHHGTTAGCLVVLDRLIRRRRFQRPLDLGCGSGILAIGLAKGLRRAVLASDIDPLAVTIAHDNVRKNGVGTLVRAVAADGFGHRAIRKTAPYDLVVANILARPLMAMATAFYRYLAPGGYAVLSGLRPADRRRVVAAFRARNLVLCATYDQDGWVTLTLRRGRR